MWYDENGEILPPIIFHHPFTCIIAGPTQSGKTVFVSKMLENCFTYIDPSPTRIIWAYGIKNVKQMEWLQQVSPIKIDFIEGIPNIEEIVDENETNLLILDDLMSSAGKSSTVQDIFTRASHHRNLSVILIMQNIFHKGTHMRDIRVNTTYTVIMKNKNDGRQILSLAQQYSPRDPNFVLDAYDKAT